MGNLALADGRREGREEVHYRVRAYGPAAREHNILVVNISAHGLMARCDTPFETGDRLRIQLPVVGVTAAEIRWSLGGRLGAQFDSVIDLAGYYELIAIMVRNR